MIHALRSIWAVLSALFLGAVGQPTSGMDPEARARKGRQRGRIEQSPPAGAMRTLGTLLRTAFYAVTFQPDNEPGTRKSQRGRHR
ncbi:hypothetical protein [Deinococcus humi]|uniref:Uncharacterized protein n=1 Tax=Deinococcus humi TaxID=662880 RepID=A0A7W8K056_9DEIO|nr:hypothetical protein [Deinococcus humi]MBB5366425.1 hypothetical protein [Deinococcus humi]GGO41874.1 hypothetical protein GCM10008949_53230 [Deinococcus humi]